MSDMPQLSQMPELTNVQSQLLKMFAYELPEEEWVDLQKMLARFLLKG
jgi:hypothetical protein